MLLGAKIFSIRKKKIKAQNKMMLWTVELDILKRVYFPLKKKIKQNTGHL